jgi:hypothetical protein
VLTSKVALANGSATSLLFNTKPMHSKIISNYAIPIMSKCGMIWHGFATNNDIMKINITNVPFQK